MPRGLEQRYKKLIELFHKSFNHRINVPLREMHWDKDSCSVCKAGLVWGELKLMLQILPNACCHHQYTVLTGLLWSPFPKNTCVDSVSSPFLNLKTTLFEAEGHHFKSLPIAILGSLVTKFVFSTPEWIFNLILTRLGMGVCGREKGPEGCHWKF